MISKTTRALVDVSACLATVWLWIAIYESFTHSGLWQVLDHALGGVTTLPEQAAVLATCVLVGWASLAAACWLIWSVFLRDRIPDDFPAARLSRFGVSRGSR